MRAKSDAVENFYILLRLTGVELLKIRAKSITWAVMGFLFVIPVLAELYMAWISPRDATFPRVTYFLFGGDMVLFVALISVIVSVMALGNDYELGVVGAILSRGVARYQFILSKVIAALLVTSVNGVCYMAGAFWSSAIMHKRLSDVPLFEAAGPDIFLRLIGVVGVIWLVGFVSVSMVMLALVLGRSAWIGMLAGLGYFSGDFVLGGLSSPDMFGIKNVFRFTFTFQALGMLEALFSSDPSFGLPRNWMDYGYADPGRGTVFLLVLGSLIIMISVLLFGRQDLTTKM